ncbi:MAG: hypothetical protein JWM09_457 [Francisellaceae bacterium]|nr:hypothetical protein [Francisellaceae bacterium]
MDKMTIKDVNKIINDKSIKLEEKAYELIGLYEGMVVKYPSASPAVNPITDELKTKLSNSVIVCSLETKPGSYSFTMKETVNGKVVTDITSKSDPAPECVYTKILQNKGEVYSLMMKNK